LQKIAKAAARHFQLLAVVQKNLARPARKWHHFRNRVQADDGATRNAKKTMRRVPLLQFENPSPSVSTYSTLHGSFEFGGGVDFRLSRWFSLRAEVRDLVTGNHLSGAAGRQLVVPTVGVALHI
jgi:hypothetical protein